MDKVNEAAEFDIASDFVLISHMETSKEDVYITSVQDNKKI